MTLPQAMGSGPLAQPVFYQYKRTVGQAETLWGNGSEQCQAERSDPGLLISKANRFGPNRPAPAQPREQTWGITPLPLPAAGRHATAAAGERPCPPPPSLALERRAAAAGRCTPRRSRGTLKDSRCRPEPCGDCSALRQVLNSDRGFWQGDQSGSVPSLRIAR
jgi:hypothetical protein